MNKSEEVVATTDEHEDAATPAVDTGPDPEETARRMSALAELYATWIQKNDDRGTDAKPTRKAMKAISAAFLELKLVPGVFSELTQVLRSTIERIRTQERNLMSLCVDQAGMPRKLFIEVFPNQETNPAWIDLHIASGAPYTEALKPLLPEIRRAQKKLHDIERDNHLSIAEIKDINRKMSIGEATARRAKKEKVEANGSPTPQSPFPGHWSSRFARGLISRVVRG